MAVGLDKAVSFNWYLVESMVTEHGVLKIFTRFSISLALFYTNRESTFAPILC